MPIVSWWPVLVTVVRQRVLESLRSPVRRFEQASGGAEALVHLESGFWQVLFLDRRLPDLDAEELSHTVRQRFPGIKVVLLDPEISLESDAETDPSNAEEGEDAVLQLPPEPAPPSESRQWTTIVPRRTFFSRLMRRVKPRCRG